MKGSKIRERTGHKRVFKIPTTAVAIKVVSQESTDNPTEI
jgi:hypothetical protein